MELALDGFNPFSHMSTSYSMWPMILISYNLPPWLTMQRSNYLLLIPGLKSLGKNFDVFLRPLFVPTCEIYLASVSYMDSK